jgi:hypothetical protein
MIGGRVEISCLFIMSDISFTIDSDSGNVDYLQGMSLGVPVFTLLPAMWHSWLEFVYANRILNRQYTQLGLKKNGRCECGKSSISYPHWPVSTVNEAFDMLNYLHDEHNKHRRYLAHQWWAFERAKSSTRAEDNMYIVGSGKGWTNVADHIIDEFKCITVDMNKDLRTTPRARG